MCHMLLFSSFSPSLPSSSVLPFLFPHLLFSRLSPSAPHPLVSVSVDSLCSSSCLCQFLMFSPVFLVPFVATMCFCSFDSFLVFLDSWFLCIVQLLFGKSRL